jgi:glycosyltransferase involved in cell wall biosynthesis
MSFRVSVMITTKNRSTDLARTLKVVSQLDPAPFEVLVTADGCTDDTVDIINKTLPTARILINAKSNGSVASRDRMMREAKGELIFSLDDDSYPEQLDCLRTISMFFEENKKLAVLHFPQRSDEYPESLKLLEFPKVHATRSFANSGAVLRRSIYISLPGFVCDFFHMYEETDYALQCIGSLHEVICTPIITIRHHYSGISRSELSNHHHLAKNEFWSTIIRCPFPLVIFMLPWRVFAQGRYAARRGWNWFYREPLWWKEALKGLPHIITLRCPVNRKRYRKWLMLP